MSDILQQCISDYQAWSPISASKAQQARRVFPGGDTRMSAHYPPYPLFMERGEGARMIDADGHELIDFMNNFTALIHGHANPQIVEAVQSQIARGSAFAAPTDNQIELGELIRTRVPSVEQLRFTASGTEATLMAIRCARAFTGRNKIMKMEGGYHGSYEMAEVSLVPHPKHSGSLSAPVAVPIDNSHSESMFEDVVVCPYNEPEAARELIRMHAEDLAAIIIEPVQGSMGMVAATAEFLQLLREESEQAGILLIFDEVITLRNGFGGMQQSLGITPDLTAMGKIIGGGLPVGAIGGREDLLRVFHPDERRPVMHSSTFSGNAVTMAAGLAAMNQISESTIEALNQKGEKLRTLFNQAFKKTGVPGQAIGSGSLINLHFTDSAVTNPREAVAGMATTQTLSACVHLMMLQRGIFSARRHMYCISTAMTDDDLVQAADALTEVLGLLKPHL